MRRLFFLFLVVLFILPGISAVSFLEDISYSPFIFGILKGDDGSVIDVSSNNFPDGKLQESSSSNFTDVSNLEFTVRNNVIFIKPLNQSATLIVGRNNIHKFNFNFNKSPEYENRNVNVLFKFND